MDTPCFGPDTMIQMSDGSLCQANQIKKGMKVFNNYTVTCVIKSKCEKHATISLEPGINITPWHPISVKSDNWIFPIDYIKKNGIEPMEIITDIVYNFVLDKGHKLIIGTNKNITTCTLGHGIKLPVVEHAYLGTRKVIDDLMLMDGWYNGLVQINKIERNLKTSEICKYS